MANGDVFDRSYLRYMEIQQSVELLNEMIANLPSGPIMRPVGAMAPETLAVSLTEGWRGTIVHTAITDATGKIERYKVTDPSFLNWFGLALALRGNGISDFPLCNKSFNLSYCGNDL
jgi:Ni,Fe-hydrogenase III large subunit